MNWKYFFWILWREELFFASPANTKLKYLAMFSGQEVLSFRLFGRAMQIESTSPWLVREKYIRFASAAESPARSPFVSPWLAGETRRSSRYYILLLLIGLSRRGDDRSQIVWLFVLRIVFYVYLSMMMMLDFILISDLARERMRLLLGVIFSNGFSFIFRT